MDYDECPHCKCAILPENETALYKDPDTGVMKLLHHECYCEIKMEEECGA